MRKEAGREGGGGGRAGEAGGHPAPLLPLAAAAAGGCGGVCWGEGMHRPLSASAAPGEELGAERGGRPAGEGRRRRAGPRCRSRRGGGGGVWVVC